MKTKKGNKKYTAKKLFSKKHEGNWVAISEDYSGVVGYSATLSRLRQSVGNKKVIYTKVLRSDIYYAFNS